MDTRIGYPNEHLSNDVPDELASPMFATGVGLVIVGIKRTEKDAVAWEEKPEGKRRKLLKSKKGKSDDRPASFLDRIQNWFDSEDIG